MIIPVVASNPGLFSLLNSLESQTYRGIEIIIVPTETLTISSNLPARVLAPPSEQGASIARNIGAQSARGRLLAFLDSDVSLERNWCQQAVSSFADPSVGAVSGQAIVSLSKFGLEYIPSEIRWVVGGTYWPHKSVTEVAGGAGMNFVVLRHVFEEVCGYNPRLGPIGDRPELSAWRRIGAEESELALRIALLGYKVLYNPKMVVTHNLDARSVTVRGLARRAMHVGHNRAVLRKFGRCNRIGFDESLVASRLFFTLLKSAAAFPKSPIPSWKALSLSAFVLSCFGLGFAFGRVEANV